jgi:hypothetical protein
MYYNTPNDIGEELRRNQKKAETNVFKVKSFFEQNPNKPYTKAEVCLEMKKIGLIQSGKLESSISVALNTLMRIGFVTKLAETKQGSQGINCHFWIHYPTPPAGTQFELF